MVVRALVFLSLAACKPATPEAVDCASIALTECTAVDGCSLTFGQPVVDDADAGGPCWDDRVPAEPLACGPDRDCRHPRDAEHVAFAAEGADTPVYAVRDTCVPEGWTTAVGPVGECSCQSLTEEECYWTEGCFTHTAQALSTDASGYCVDPTAELEPVICGRSYGQCGGLDSYAVQPSTGTVFLFSDICAPANWAIPGRGFDTCQP